MYLQIIAGRMQAVTRAVILMAYRGKGQGLRKDLAQMWKYKIFVKVFWSISYFIMLPRAVDYLHRKCITASLLCTMNEIQFQAQLELKCGKHDFEIFLENKQLRIFCQGGENFLRNHIQHNLKMRRLVNQTQEN